MLIGLLACFMLVIATRNISAIDPNTFIFVFTLLVLSLSIAVCGLIYAVGGWLEYEEDYYRKGEERYVSSENN